MEREEKIKVLAKVLEYERLKRGMSQQEFADFLEIPRSSITNYLLGNIFPNAIKIKQMSTKLNVDLAAKIIYKEGCNNE